LFQWTIRRDGFDKPKLHITPDIASISGKGANPENCVSGSSNWNKL
jgi:hypothetical protein